MAFTQRLQKQTIGWIFRICLLAVLSNLVGASFLRGNRESHESVSLEEASEFDSDELDFAIDDLMMLEAEEDTDDLVLLEAKEERKLDFRNGYRHNHHGQYPYNGFNNAVRFDEFGDLINTRTGYYSYASPYNTVGTNGYYSGYSSPRYQSYGSFGPYSYGSYYYDDQDYYGLRPTSSYNSYAYNNYGSQYNYGSYYGSYGYGYSPYGSSGYGYSPSYNNGYYETSFYGDSLYV